MDIQVKAILAHLVDVGEVFTRESHPLLWSLFWLEMKELTEADVLAVSRRVAAHMQEANKILKKTAPDPAEFAAAQQHIDEIMRVFPQWVSDPSAPPLERLYHSLRRLLESQR